MFGDTSIDVLKVSRGLEILVLDVIKDESFAGSGDTGFGRT